MPTLLITSVGFLQIKKLHEAKQVNYNFTIELSEQQALKEVLIFWKNFQEKQSSPRYSSENLGEKSVKTASNQFAQYQMEKYEKVEFDINSIDDTYRKQKLFKGMELYLIMLTLPKLLERPTCRSLLMKHL